MIWAKKHQKTWKYKIKFDVNIQCLDTYFFKILEKLKEYSLRTPETKKKRNFSLKTLEIKNKNKKKIGSNDENLRKLEPQQKQRIFIKKKKCILC